LKKGDFSQLNKEIGNKKNNMTWSVDCLARAFRELYSNLVWFKVFEAFGNIKDSDIPSCKQGISLDNKGLALITTLYNRCKP